MIDSVMNKVRIFPEKKSKDHEIHDHIEGLTNVAKNRDVSYRYLVHETRFS